MVGRPSRAAGPAPEARRSSSCGVPTRPPPGGWSTHRNRQKWHPRRRTRAPPGEPRLKSTRENPNPRTVHLGARMVRVPYANLLLGVFHRGSSCGFDNQSFKKGIFSRRFLFFEGGAENIEKDFSKNISKTLEKKIGVVVGRPARAPGPAPEARRSSSCGVPTRPPPGGRSTHRNRQK